MQKSCPKLISTLDNNETKIKDIPNFISLVWRSSPLFTTLKTLNIGQNNIVIHKVPRLGGKNGQFQQNRASNL